MHSNQKNETAQSSHYESNGATVFHGVNAQRALEIDTIHGVSVRAVPSTQGAVRVDVVVEAPEVLAAIVATLLRPDAERHRKRAVEDVARAALHNLELSMAHRDSAHTFTPGELRTALELAYERGHAASRAVL